MDGKSFKQALYDGRFNTGPKFSLYLYQMIPVPNFQHQARPLHGLVVDRTGRKALSTGVPGVATPSSPGCESARCKGYERKRCRRVVWTDAAR